MTVSVTLRSTKGQPLTNAEMDANFATLAAGVNSALSTNATTVPATSTTLGGIIVGTGLQITSSGVLSVTSTGTGSGSGSGTGSGSGSTGVVDASYIGGIETLQDVSIIQNPTTLKKLRAGAGILITGSTGYVTITATAGSTGGSTGGSSGGSGTTYTLTPATSSVLGGVKVGSGLSIDGSGTLSANSYTLPTATNTTLGGVRVGTGLAMDGNGTLGLAGMRILAAVNFKWDGTIRKQSNVSAIVRTSAGKWTVVFATPMPDVNYLVVGTVGTDWDTASMPGWNNAFIYGASTGSPSSNKTVNSVLVCAIEPTSSTTEDTSGISMIVLG